MKKRRPTSRDRLEDSVTYAEVAHVVASLIEDALDKLDPVHLRRVTEEAERGGTTEAGLP